MELLEGLVRRAGGAGGEALVSVGDDDLSAEGLLAAADATAERIRGARAVAVCAAPTMSTVVGIVSALRAGVAVVPIAHDSGASERHHILNDSGAVAMLGDHPWDDVSLPSIPIGGSGGSLTAGSSSDLNDAALIMYTSGTTGAPKGVLMPASPIAACLDGLADAWQWSEDDHLVHGLPLFHVHGLVLGILGSLRRGCRVSHTVRPTPEAYAAKMSDGATMFFGVPTVWSRMVADPTSARALNGARAIVSGSAALPVAVFDELRELTGVVPLERYGMTETMITLSTRIDGERRPGHVGLPLNGVETRLRGDDGDILANDGESIGTLEVRGATIGAGYLNRPDATAEATTSDGWFVTGDSAVIGEDGMHRIVGRTSVDIIKSGGYKVGAGEVEASVAELPAVAEVAVVGVTDGDLGQRIEAVIVPVEGMFVSADEVIDHVAAQLSIHKRPRNVHIVESLPRNALGKVQKAQIRASLEESA
jgi:fatty acid CoA ligase FadD36